MRGSPGTHPPREPCGPPPRGLCPAAQDAGRGVVWLGDEPFPEARRVARGRSASGSVAGTPWLGFIANHDHVVKGAREVPLVPPPLMLLLALMALALAWRPDGM